MSVIDEIAAERKRQIEVEGWSAQHDDEHTDGQMAAAAACYAMEAAINSGWPPVGVEVEIPTPEDCWPWDAKWWKPKTRRQDLVRAAALLIAEIERLDRAKP